MFWLRNKKIKFSLRTLTQSPAMYAHNLCQYMYTFLLDETNFSFVCLNITWVKVFRIIPEVRVLRKKVSLKILNQADYNSFPDIFSVYLKRIGCLNLKLLIFVGILQVLRFEFLKVRTSKI